jgi:glutamine cyclotransferase
LAAGDPKPGTIVILTPNMNRTGILVILSAFICSCMSGSCRSGPADEPAATPSIAPATEPAAFTIHFTLANVYPHDTASFTEGLVVHNGELYESTGHTDEIPSSRSLFGVVDPLTGKIHVKAELDKSKYFGEGIVFLHGKVYQLTYKTRIGFVYDAASFKQLREFTYPSEQGWGMTTDGTYLIMSDSTPDLHYLDPQNFNLIKTLRITENGEPVDQVNELEYIDGYIYANRFTQNYILKIDPANGKVAGRLDLSSLDDQAHIKYPGSLQMNGIAYDSVSDKVFVTGKRWPDIYEIRFPH